MLDATDRSILAALADNARLSLKELAGVVKLSSPAVAERLRRLEERGVIRAFTIELDPQALGYPLQSLVRLHSLPGKLHILQAQLAAIPEIVECDKVTGEDCFIARLFVRTIEQLDEILEGISNSATTNTMIVKAQPVRRRLPPLAG
ncbi:Lrp/AsnC family transcriptional regulator [Roseiterribacter gracilis]|uniref:AsnC family transcriptional regulator n=1 Tax=Roseiterribacter gracilis TaxID=2812848 RepID=A0A8S8XB54_9PROT|nr:AsnC family transcriptional regulator [Rhodospirillales bacterium TMPK1]